MNYIQLYFSFYEEVVSFLIPINSKNSLEDNTKLYIAETITQEPSVIKQTSLLDEIV